MLGTNSSPVKDLGNILHHDLFYLVELRLDAVYAIIFDVVEIVEAMVC